MKLTPFSTVAAALAVALTGSSASAQRNSGPPNDSLRAAEHSGRYGRGYRTGDLHLPGTRDPFDHAFVFDVGIFRDSDTSGGTTDTVLLTPMRITLDTQFGHHFQLHGRFGLAGIVDSVETPPAAAQRTRTFRPGNLALGGYYVFGGVGAVKWTVGAGGQLVAPTSQQDSVSLAEFGAYGGALAVHGLEDAWIFLPNTFAVVPGAYARIASGPVFANVRADLDLNVATDSGTRNHLFQVRLEAGYRSGENWRLGVGYTNVVTFGSNAPSDASQGALRVFVRGDVKILTLGCELVMNLDKPLGFAFDSNGIWGVVSTLGVSL